MLSIKQIPLTSRQDLERYNAMYHTDVDEYIPTAKAMSYQDLINSRAILFVFRFEDANDPGATALIQSKATLSVFVAIYRTLATMENLTPVSISYCSDLDENKPDTGLMLVTAVVYAGNLDHVAKPIMDTLTLSLAKKLRVLIAPPEKEKVILKKGTFISSFYTEGERVPDSQIDAYKNSSEDKPFLNTIDKYVPLYDIEDLEAPKPMYHIEATYANAQTTASKIKLQKLFEQTMYYFTNVERTLFEMTMRGESSNEKFMNDIKNYVNRHLSIPEEDKEVFFGRLQEAFLSYYVLTPAIKDPDISDIRVLSYDNINVKVKGSHYVADGLQFINQEDYERFIQGLILKNHIKVNNPILVFTDKDYNPDYILRFNLCLPDINTTDSPYLHIRKIPKNKISLDKLIDAGMLDEKLAAYLLDKVATSKGIVFSGPSASGKTTLMNALIDYIPKDKSICCIQESEELFSNIHPNAYFQHMLKDEKGRTIVGLSELGQNGLLCDSGYFIIGEIKGAEARDLLRASNTGHKCWCSIHAQSSEETIPRLADYVKYGSDYSLTEAMRMLKDLEVIVYIQNFQITEITEIAGYDDDKGKILYRPVYRQNF